MSTSIDPKEKDNYLTQLLNKIVYSLGNLPFLYHASGSETDINSNSLVISNALVMTGMVMDVPDFTYLDGYAEQQMARQSSIQQWYNTVRKKVI